MLLLLLNYKKMIKYQSFHLNNTERKSNLLRGCNLKERPCHCCTKTKRLTTDRNLPWRYIEKSEKENKLGVRLAMESPVNWWRKERMKRLLLLLCSSPLPLLPGDRGKKKPLLLKVVFLWAYGVMLLVWA